MRTKRLRPARTARGRATRARIVAAAATLVRDHGLANTSLDAVIAASQTSKSQLYHYFSDKEDLLLAVIQHQTTSVLAAQEPHLREVASLAGLRRWRDAVVELTRKAKCAGGCPLGSLVPELAEAARPRALLADGFARWRALLVAGFEAMGDNGELRAGADPEDLATAVLTALQGGLLLAQTARSTRPLEVALDMALDYVSAQPRIP